MRQQSGLYGWVGAAADGRRGKCGGVGQIFGRINYFGTQSKHPFRLFLSNPLFRPSDSLSDSPTPAPVQPTPDIRPSTPSCPADILARPKTPHPTVPTMARGRVPLESRRRSQRACSFCRMSKKRCDGASPCHNCARRGREASCVYTRYGSERRERAPRPAVPRTDDVDGPLSGRSTVEATNSSYPTPDASTAREDPSSCSQYMHPRMLRNGTAGEKGASLSAPISPP